MQQRSHPILLVEDSVDDQLLILRAFAKAKLSITVDDGDKAVAYPSGHLPYDDRAAYPLPTIILLDLKLPRRSGHEVLQWIQAHPTCAVFPSWFSHPRLKAQTSKRPTR